MKTIERALEEWATDAILFTVDDGNDIADAGMVDTGRIAQENQAVVGVVLFKTHSRVVFESICNLLRSKWMNKMPNPVLKDYTVDDLGVWMDKFFDVRNMLRFDNDDEMANVLFRKINQLSSAIARGGGNYFEQVSPGAWE